MAAEMEEGSFFKNVEDDFNYGVTVSQSPVQVRLGKKNATI